MRGLATYEVPSTDVNTPEQYHTWVCTVPGTYELVLVVYQIYLD